MAVIVIKDENINPSSISLGLGSLTAEDTNKLTVNATVGGKEVSVEKDIEIRPKVYYIQYISEHSSSDRVGFYYGLKSTNAVNSTVSITPPSCEGYNFKGWYTDSDLTNKCDSLDASAHEDIVLYAKWAESFSIIPLETPISAGTSSTVTVSWEDSDTTGEISWKSSDETIATVDNAGNIKGVNAGSVDITATYGSLTRTINVNILPTWTVSLTVNGGDTLSVSSYSVVDGNTVDLPTPTRSGYTFKGWKIGGTYIDNTTEIHSNMILTAEWVDETAPGLVQNVHAIVGTGDGTTRPVSVEWVNPEVTSGTALSSIRAEAWYENTLVYSTSVSSTVSEINFSMIVGAPQYIVKLYSVDEAGNVSEPAELTIFQDTIKTTYNNTDKDYLSLGTLTLSLDCTGHTCTPTWSISGDGISLYNNTITGTGAEGTSIVYASVGSVTYTKTIKTVEPFTALLSNEILKSDVTGGKVALTKEYDVTESVTWASEDENIVQISDEGYTASSLSSARTGSTNLVGTLIVGDTTYTKKLPVAVQFVSSSKYISASEAVSAAKLLNGSESFTIPNNVVITGIDGKSSASTITTVNGEWVVTSLSTNDCKYEKRTYILSMTDGTNAYTQAMTIEVLATGCINITYDEKLYSDYVVCYDISGGTISGTTIVSSSSGTLISKPTINPFWPGYVFCGWYADAKYTKSFVFDTVPTEQVTVIYAKWEPGFDIYYNGSVYESTDTITVNSAGATISVVKRPEINEKGYLNNVSEVKQTNAILFDWDSSGQNGVAYFESSHSNTSAVVKMNGNGSSDVIGITLLDCTQYIKVKKSS